MPTEQQNKDRANTLAQQPPFFPGDAHMATFMRVHSASLRRGELAPLARTYRPLATAYGDFKDYLHHRRSNNAANNMNVIMIDELKDTLSTFLNEYRKSAEYTRDNDAMLTSYLGSVRGLAELVHGRG